MDIRGALLNSEFTATGKPIYLKINKDVVPYWILQDQLAAPYVSEQGELLLSLLLLDRFLYGLKQSPLNRISPPRSLPPTMPNPSMTNVFFKRRDSKFSYISTHYDDLLHCSNCQIMVNQLIRTCVDRQYHDQATSYVDMTITRSRDQSQIFISQQGLAQRIISDFLPDDFPATSPASS